MSGLRPGEEEAAAIERDEYGHPANIGEVAIEEVEERLGWAVFGGCEGETANFHAFFKHKSDADEYVAWCTKDHDADNWITDPGVAAAAIIGGRIVAANHYDDELGAGVIARAAGVLGDEAERFKDEAAPKSEPGVRPSETQATRSPSCTSRCEWGSSVAVGEQCTATCARETEHAARAHFCGAHDPHPYLYASIVVPPAPRTWRGGRSVGRTLYKNDRLVGIVDTRELAEELTAAANFAEDVEAFHEGVRSAPMRCPCCESTVAPDGQPLGQPRAGLDPATVQACAHWLRGLDDDDALTFESIASAMVDHFRAAEPPTEQPRTATHPALLDLFFEVEQHIKKNSTLEMGGRKFKTPSIAKLADALAYARECTEQAT